MDKVSIGKITKPKGVKGEIRVIPLTDNLLRFRQLDEIAVIDDSGESLTYEVESLVVTGKTILLKLKGVDSRNQAEEFRGKEIVIDKVQIFPLDKGDYYIFQIIGLEAFDENGEYLGEIVDVLKNPGNDVFILRRQEKEYLIPAVKEIVKNVDLKDRKIVINCIEGLIE